MPTVTVGGEAVTGLTSQSPMQYRTLLMVPTRSRMKIRGYCISVANGMCKHLCSTKRWPSSNLCNSPWKTEIDHLSLQVEQVDASQRRQDSKLSVWPLSRRNTSGSYQLMLSFYTQQQSLSAVKAATCKGMLELHKPGTVTQSRIWGDYRSILRSTETKVAQSIRPVNSHRFASGTKSSSNSNSWVCIKFP